MIHELTDLGQKHARTIKRLAKRVGQSSEKMGEALVAGAKRKFGSRSKLLIHNVLGKSWAKVEAKSASKVNAEFIARGEQAAYKKGTTVLEGISAQEDKYVRLYADGLTQQKGRFMAKWEDVIGKDGSILPRPELKSKFGLKHEPTHMVDANIPAGKKMRTGICSEVHEFNAKGGGRQYQILEDDPDANWFSNERALP